MRVAIAATVALAAGADAFPHFARHMQAHHDMVERGAAHADAEERGLFTPLGDVLGRIEAVAGEMGSKVLENVKGPTPNDILGMLTGGKLPSVDTLADRVTDGLKGDGGEHTESIFSAFTKNLSPDGKPIDFGAMNDSTYGQFKDVLGKLDLGAIGSRLNLDKLAGDGVVDFGPFRQAVPKLGEGIDLGKLNLVGGVQQLGVRGMDFLNQLAGELKTFNPVTMAQFAVEIKRAQSEIYRRAEANPKFGGWTDRQLKLANTWAKELTKDKIYDAYNLHRSDDEQGIWGGGEDADHPYQAPGPDDARGPCPGLNTLANHGYIPRSGVVSPYELMLGVWEGFTMAPETSALLAFGAFTMKGDLWAPKLSIGGKSKYGGGQGLNSHGFFEGDASVTRGDWANGDCVGLNRTRYDIYRGEIAQYGTDGDINEHVCAHSRQRAYVDSRAENPSFDFNPLRELIAYAESGFAMEVFRGAGKRCTADTIEWFFDKERFPPGWRRRDVPITMAELLTWGMLFQQIAGSNPGYNVGGQFVPIPKVPGTWTSFVSGGTVKMNSCSLVSLFMVLLPAGAATFAIGNGILPVVLPGGFNCW